MSTPTLIIDCALTNPPTILSSFRDFTLTFHKRTDIILECETGFKDRYWVWLKKTNPGNWDFISDIVHYSDQEKGFRITPIRGFLWSIEVDRINEGNLRNLISGVNFFLF